ncbi:MAG: hypothetical protein P8X89_11400 [Reinekea sp.]
MACALRRYGVTDSGQPLCTAQWRFTSAVYRFIRRTKKGELMLSFFRNWWVV